MSDHRPPQKQKRYSAGRSWLAEALTITALLLLPLLFWWRLWALDPADRAVIPEGDLTSQYYPLQRFAAQELAAGHLPGWDPYINAGQPGLADIQTGVFYPLNLLANGILALLGRPFGLGVLQAQVMLHFSLASLFTYLLVRHLVHRAGARRAAARFAGAVAALSFTYAGYLTSFPVQQLTILETAVWLPLVLLFVDMSFQRTGPAASIWRIPSTVILAGMALACALLAGHPQTAMYVVYATLAYGLFRASTVKPETPSIASHGPRFTVQVLRIACCIMLPIALGVTLSAVQLLPTIGFIARSTRAGLDYNAVSWGFPLAEITHLLYPGYFGGSPQYVGIVPPILAVAAFLVRQARREVVFWTLFGAAAFLLAFGGNAFVYDVAYLLLPGFGAVRDQERIIYLFSFAVSVLAGYGALTLVQPLPRLVRAAFQRFCRVLGRVWVLFLALTALWYFGTLLGMQQDAKVNLFEGVLRHHALILLVLGGAVLLFWLRSTVKIRRTLTAALALGLIGLNLFTVNGRFNLADPVPGGPFSEAGVVRFLRDQPGTFRISSAGLLPGGASAGIVYELEDITANTPLRLEAFQRYEDEVASWRRWQLLNVHYVLSERDLDGPGLERVYEEGKVKVYRIGDPLPRAWVVHNLVVADGDRAIDRLNADEFDPRATAVLPPTDEVPDTSGESIPGVAPQVVEAGPGRLILDIAPQAGGLLVVSQPFYPGWRARIDGQPVPIYRADLFLQGIPVTAGTHRVELTYRLSPWPAVISLAALLACLAGLGLRRRSE